MHLRDTLERLVWTVVAAFTGLLAVGPILDISAIEAAVGAAATAGLNFLTLIARARLAVLPSPGDGLPGLPADDGRADLLTIVVLVLVGLAALAYLAANVDVTAH